MGERGESGRYRWSPLFGLSGGGCVGVWDWSQFRRTIYAVVSGARIMNAVVNVIVGVVCGYCKILKVWSKSEWIYVCFNVSECACFFGLLMFSFTAPWVIS